MHLSHCRMCSLPNELKVAVARFIDPWWCENSITLGSWDVNCSFIGVLFCYVFDVIADLKRHDTPFYMRRSFQIKSELPCSGYMSFGFNTQAATIEIHATSADLVSLYDLFARQTVQSQLRIAMLLLTLHVPDLHTQIVAIRFSIPVESHKVSSLKTCLLRFQTLPPLIGCA